MSCEPALYSAQASIAHTGAAGGGRCEAIFVRAGVTSPSYPGSLLLSDTTYSDSPSASLRIERLIRIQNDQISIQENAVSDNRRTLQSVHQRDRVPRHADGGVRGERIG